MATYGQSNLSLTVGGTEMKAYIQTINDFEIQALNEEGDTFGDSWIENLYSGVQRGMPLTLGGIYDDTAVSGPNAKFNAVGTSVAIVITWGGAKTSTFTGLITSYKRMASRGVLTRYEVTILPSGAVTEA